MTSYFLKINGLAHTTNGICHPRSKEDWEGISVRVPPRPPGYLGRRHTASTTAPEIQTGDLMWIWTHEHENHGRGWGLTARARAGAQSAEDDFWLIEMTDVHLLTPPFGFRKLERSGWEGISALEHADGYRWHAYYLLSEEEDRELRELVDLQEAQIRASPASDQLSDWNNALSDHKDALLAGLRDRRERTIKDRPAQAEFRRGVLDRYGSRCLVTGCRLLEAVEAAHVMPHTGEPIWDRPENGIPLRRDWHALFDAFHWTVHPRTGEVWMTEEMRRSGYREFDRRRLEHQVPTELLVLHHNQYRKLHEK